MTRSRRAVGGGKARRIDGGRTMPYHTFPVSRPFWRRRVSEELRGVREDAVTGRWVAMRPEGIGRCRRGHHPVLLLRAIEGGSGAALRIDEGEARLLVGERDGVRSRHSRTYETLEQILMALGGTVVALQLVGDRRRGLSGEIELACDGRRIQVRAHPGDVAALAWRLNLAVLVPAEVASVPFEEASERWCEAPSEIMPERDEVVTFRRFLEEASPEDYDW